MNIRDIIITIILFVVCISLGYYLTSKINEPIVKQKKIDQEEAEIIAKLKLIRNLQLAYSTINGSYAGKWKDLIEFAENGELLIINKKEINDLKENGEETVKVIIDTLGSVSVKDSLFKGKYKKYKPSEIAIIPNSNGRKFSLYAARKLKNDIMVNLLEVKDIYPKNPERGAQFNDKGEPWSVPTLKKLYKKKHDKKDAKAKKLLVEIRDKERAGASESEIKELQYKVDDLSKYINLYRNRIKQLDTKPLQIGSREEATIAGNWKKSKDL